MKRWRSWSSSNWTKNGRNSKKNLISDSNRLMKIPSFLFYCFFYKALYRRIFKWLGFSSAGFLLRKLKWPTPVREDFTELEGNTREREVQRSDWQSIHVNHHRPLELAPRNVLTLGSIDQSLREQEDWLRLSIKDGRLPSTFFFIPTDSRFQKKRIRWINSISLRKMIEMFSHLDYGRCDFIV